MIMSMASFFTIALSFVTVGRRLLCREKEREEKKKKDHNVGVVSSCSG